MRTTRNTLPTKVVETEERGETRVICPCCDEIVNTRLKPPGDVSVSFQYALCQPCDKAGAVDNVIKASNEVIDLVDNPATKWDMNNLARAVAVLSRGYKVMAAEFDMIGGAYDDEEGDDDGTD